MEEPIDSFDLLDRRGQSFHPASYVKEYAPFRWTYIAGYPLLLETFYLIEPGFANIRAVRDYIKGLRTRAVGLIPQGWKTRFPEGDWSGCNSVQIEDACKGFPLRFDKACLALKSLQLAYEKADSDELRNLDFYKFVQLRPAIFALRELDDKARALLRKNNLNSEEQAEYEALVQRLCPPDGRDEELNRRAVADTFLHQAADGYGMTWVNAKLIKKYLVEVKGGQVRVGMLEGRADQGRMVKKKACNPSENHFVSLDGELINFLAELRTRVRKKA